MSTVFRFMLAGLVAVLDAAALWSVVCVSSIAQRGQSDKTRGSFDGMGRSEGV